MVPDDLHDHLKVHYSTVCSDCRVMASGERNNWRLCHAIAECYKLLEANWSGVSYAGYFVESRKNLNVLRNSATS